MAFDLEAYKAKYPGRWAGHLDDARARGGNGNGLMRRLAAMGRNGDTDLAHVAKDEAVVPERVLDTGDTRAQLKEGFDDANLPMERYIVGADANSRNPMTGQREYFDLGGFVGGLVKAGTKLIGGATKAIGSIFGLGAGGATGAASGLNLAMNIFGGSDDDPWGILDSPVMGHVVGAVGKTLLAGDPVEERLRLERALREDRRREIRRNYGLPEEVAKQKPGQTAARYMGNGMALAQ